MSIALLPKSYALVSHPKHCWFESVTVCVASIVGGGDKRGVLGCTKGYVVNSCLLIPFNPEYEARGLANVK